jgi:hypothetical protein
MNPLTRLCLVLVLAGTGCGLSLEEYRDVVEEAQVCAPGDRCVLAGGGQCTCATPVNEREAARIDEAAADVRCGGAMPECPAHFDVRCEAGRCVSSM